MGSCGQEVGLQGFRGSRGMPTGSKGVKGWAKRVSGGQMVGLQSPREQGVGLQGPRGSSGRPAGSQGARGRPTESKRVKG